MLGGGAPAAEHADYLVTLIQAADPDRQRRALQALRATPAPGRQRRLCLIGLRGAGKSTLGQMAGAALGLPFRELNDEISRPPRQWPIGEVMALYGPEGYRKLERQGLERVVAETDAAVLAVAGGIVAEPRTYGYLLRQVPHGLAEGDAARTHGARPRPGRRAAHGRQSEGRWRIWSAF